MTIKQIENRLAKKGWHLTKCSKSEYNLVLNDKNDKCMFCDWGTIWRLYEKAVAFEKQYLIWPYSCNN